MQKEISHNSIPPWLTNELDIGRVMTPEEAYDFWKLMEKGGQVHRINGQLIYLGAARGPNGPVGIGGMVTPREGMQGCVVFENTTVPFTVMKPPHPYVTDTVNSVLGAIDTEFKQLAEQNQPLQLGTPWHAMLNEYQDHLDQLFKYGLLVAVHEQQPGLDYARLLTLDPAKLLDKLWLEGQCIRFEIEQIVYSRPQSSS